MYLKLFINIYLYTFKPLLKRKNNVKACRKKINWKMILICLICRHTIIHIYIPLYIVIILVYSFKKSLKKSGYISLNIFKTKVKIKKYTFHNKNCIYF